MNNKPREFTKVDRALEVRVIDWLQWTEWDEKPGQKHPAELALEMISLRKRYCIELQSQADEMAEAMLSVLCDPSGKCCMDGSDGDRAVIDEVLAKYREFKGE